MTNLSTREAAQRPSDHAKIGRSKPVDAGDLSGFEWPFYGYAPGGYTNTCRGCGKTVYGVAKRAYHCLPCALKAAAENFTTQSARIAELEEALRNLVGFIPPGLCRCQPTGDGMFECPICRARKTLDSTNEKGTGDDD